MFSAMDSILKADKLTKGKGQMIKKPELIVNNITRRYSTRANIAAEKVKKNNADVSDSLSDENMNDSEWDYDMYEGNSTSDLDIDVSPDYSPLLVVQPPVQARIQPHVQLSIQSPVQPHVQPSIQAHVQAPVQVTVQPHIQPHVQATVQPNVQPHVQLSIQSPVQPHVQPHTQAPVQRHTQPPVKATVQPPAQATVQQPLISHTNKIIMADNIPGYKIKEFTKVNEPADERRTTETTLPVHTETSSTIKTEVVDESYEASMKQTKTFRRLPKPSSNLNNGDSTSVAIENVQSCEKEFKRFEKVPIKHKIFYEVPAGADDDSEDSEELDPLKSSSDEDWNLNKDMNIKSKFYNNYRLPINKIKLPIKKPFLVKDKVIKKRGRPRTNFAIKKKYVKRGRPPVDRKITYKKRTDKKIKEKIIITYSSELPTKKMRATQTKLRKILPKNVIINNQNLGMVDDENTLSLIVDELNRSTNKYTDRYLYQPPTDKVSPSQNALKPASRAVKNSTSECSKEVAPPPVVTAVLLVPPPVPALLVPKKEPSVALEHVFSRPPLSFSNDESLINVHLDPVTHEATIRMVDGSDPVREFEATPATDDANQVKRKRGRPPKKLSVKKRVEQSRLPNYFSDSDHVYCKYDRILRIPKRGRGYTKICELSEGTFPMPVRPSVLGRPIKEPVKIAPKPPLVITSPLDVPRLSNVNIVNIKPVIIKLPMGGVLPKQTVAREPVRVTPPPVIVKLLPKSYVSMQRAPSPMKRQVAMKRSAPVDRATLVPLTSTPSAVYPGPHYDSTTETDCESDNLPISEIYKRGASSPYSTTSEDSFELWQPTPAPLQMVKRSRGRPRKVRSTLSNFSSDDDLPLTALSRPLASSSPPPTSVPSEPYARSNDPKLISLCPVVVLRNIFRRGSTTRYVRRVEALLQ